MGGKENYKKDDIDKLNIKQLAERLGIRFKGRQALCPFHDDDNPSLYLNDNNTLHCFGCGIHLTPSRLLNKMRTLGKDTNIELKDIKRFTNEIEKEENIEMAFKNWEILTHLINKLYQKDNRKAIEYLEKRGINPYLADKMKVCYLPSIKELGFLFQYATTTELNRLGINRIYHNPDFAGEDFILLPYIQGKMIRAIKFRNFKEKEQRIYFALGNIGEAIYNCEEVYSDGKEIFITEGEIKTLALLSKGYKAIGFSGRGNFTLDKFELVKHKRIIINLDKDAQIQAYNIKIELKKRGYNVALLLLDKQVDEFLLTETDLTPYIID